MYLLEVSFFPICAHTEVTVAVRLACTSASRGSGAPLRGTLCICRWCCHLPDISCPATVPVEGSSGLCSGTVSVRQGTCRSQSCSSCCTEAPSLAPALDLRTFLLAGVYTGIYCDFYGEWKPLHIGSLLVTSISGCPLVPRAPGPGNTPRRERHRERAFSACVLTLTKGRVLDDLALRGGGRLLNDEPGDERDGVIAGGGSAEPLG